MGILVLAMITVLFLVLTALDIAMFFVVVRIVTRRWPARWIVAFDAAGKSLVDGILGVFGQTTQRAQERRMREGPKLVLSLIILWLVRATVILTLRAMTEGAS